MINTIIHGDCIDVLPRVPDASIDLVIADPPYFKVVAESWDYEHEPLIVEMKRCRDELTKHDSR